MMIDLLSYVMVWRIKRIHFSIDFQRNTFYPTAEFVPIIFEVLKYQWYFRQKRNRFS